MVYSLINDKKIVINESGEINRVRSSGIICKKIINNKIYFLLVKQISGKWSFPKGGHEDYENTIECALREFKEEVGIDITKINKELLKCITIFCNTYFICSSNKLESILTNEQIKEFNNIEYNKILSDINNFKNENENKNEISCISWIDYDTILNNISVFNADVRMVIYPKKLYIFHNKIYGKKYINIIQTQYQCKKTMVERYSPIHFLTS